MIADQLIKKYNFNIAILVSSLLCLVQFFDCIFIKNRPYILNIVDTKNGSKTFNA
ncbi:hypothetical protein lam_156 [Candidatus Liberibacter americanus str. Sao Paulo]|uniref:Uncharacterized protein n=1 Tax=Candidatus Liberibacter americanus str. Sao Paulo TaxID=1261131 RepID=U6B3L4_9HYPH|nr:hypothetical protein lam_156 [Candidatus Liberibacter americanus str. Sao Paulo]